MPDNPTSPSGHGLDGKAPPSGASRQELLARLLRERASAARGGDHPLSYNQRSLWFLNRLDPRSAAYNVAYAWRVRSPLDPTALRRAFARLVQRHAILRTVYGAAEPVQRTLDRQELDFATVDAAGWSDADRVRRLSDEAQLPFDLEHGPVMRVRLFVSDTEAPVLLVVFHHIAYDLWSMVTLVDELDAFYASDHAGVSCSLPPIRHQYLDFVRWQADLLERDGDRLWAFWREYLSGELPVLALPADYARPPVQSGLGATHAKPLPARLAAAASAVARAEQTTVFNVFLAAFQALLHQLSGQSQILVGSPVAGRSRPEFENLIGYFLNTLPFRADATGDPSFRTFLAQVRQRAHGVLQHQDYPLELLVARKKPARSAGHAPLFQALFVLNRPHVRREQRDLREGGLVLELLPLDLETAQFDISLELDQFGDATTARWEYSTDLFEAATIERWAQLFERLLEEATAEPDRRLSELANPGNGRDQVGVRAAADGPRTAPEETVAALYSEVLQRPCADVTDSFVALGGTSVHAVQIVNRLTRLAGVDLPLSEFFELLTVERVAAWLEDALLDGLESASPAPANQPPESSRVFERG